MTTNMFPSEINYSIIRNIHPYYLMQGYCGTSSAAKDECMENIYDLLQVWVHPELSKKELKVMFPDLTFKQLVNLALIYSPIIELFSSGLDTILDHPIDIMHIFLHACKVGNREVANYILQEIPNIASFSDHIMAIAFYYNMEELIDTSSHVVSTTNSIIRVKLGYNVEEEITIELANLLLEESEINLLWKLEDRAEFVCILSLLTNEPFPPYLCMIGVSYNPDSNYHILANLLGKEKLTSIVRKYALYDEVTLYPEVPLKPNIRMFFEHYPEMNFGKLLLQPELAPQYITNSNKRKWLPLRTFVEANLPEYYLLSGNYEYYLRERWKLEKSNGPLYKFGTMLASTDILGRVMVYRILLEGNIPKYLFANREIKSYGITPTSQMKRLLETTNYSFGGSVFKLSFPLSSKTC